ncbi:MAG: tRNA(Ile)-lysidine synthase [Firmicutes bacterium]|nr:tRNA(Ile)-lysidine synthase [Bacillota bacterium]
MLGKVKKWIERNHLLAVGDKIVVACSGGPDSLALVRVMKLLAEEYHLELAVAHVNHMFRGAESDGDAEFVKEYCAMEGLPLYATAIDVPKFIEISGRSPEEAARFLRYRYLRKVAKSLGGAKIATGHHRDDQAETVLINLLRGTGAVGLGGIKPISQGIIRPFLNISRQDIEVFCRQQQLKPRLDSSNLKTDYLRNYVRLELMPLLKKKFNANLAEGLCRTACLLGDTQQFIDNCAEKAWTVVAKEHSEEIEICCNKLNPLHIALKRELIRKSIEKKRGSLKEITFFHVEKVVELAMVGQTGKVIELPGNLIVEKIYEKIVLKHPNHIGKVGIIAPGVEINLSETTVVSELGLKIVAELAGSQFPKTSDCVVFDWEKITPPLYVRTRMDGDRFLPAGMNGSKKVKDFFIDAKVPQSKRDSIPILCDSQGIISVGVYRQAAWTLPDKDTREFLQITIKSQGS